MKSQLIAIVAALLVVGCGESQPPEPPDVSIIYAAGTGNIEAVKRRLAAGADVNVSTYVVRHDLDGKPVEHGYTALHAATTKEVAELLIAAGADVNALSDHRTHRGGWRLITPLDQADGDEQRQEIADLLRKHGGKTGEELKAEGK